MCGIAGYFGRKVLDRERIDRTLERMRSRGPDHQEAAAFPGDRANAYLLHARLSILDLDPRSHQPFTADGATIAFNGEIYNYLELRKDLEVRGIGLSTRSDTEVLLRYYLLHGEDCVRHFEGMWSFAIFDSRKGTLFLSRDRFGEKPLFLHETPDGIYFASEVKHLETLGGGSLRVNRRHLLRYLVNGYKSLFKTAETYWEGVRPLPSGSCLRIGPDLAGREWRYWTPSIGERPMTSEQAVEGFRHHLLESMRIRLRADVPIAFCLSGGVDSGALASVAAKTFGYRVAAFSLLDADTRYHEGENIAATVEDLGCASTLIEVRPQRDLSGLRALVDYHDGPICTISYFIHSWISAEMARQGFRVAVSGTGADELVTGYYDHFLLHLHAMRGRKDYAEAYLRPWEKHVKPFTRNPHLQDADLYAREPSFRGHVYLNRDTFAGYLKAPFDEGFREAVHAPSLLRNRMLNELLEEVVPPILHEDDLNSMFHSIENRSPFLDSRLVDFSCSIPPEHLMRDGFAKYPLRAAMQGILNDKVRLCHRKVGFNASLSSLIDLGPGPVRDWLLEDSAIYELVDREKVAPLLSMRELPNSFSKFLFNFINAKLFLELKA